MNFLLAAKASRLEERVEGQDWQGIPSFDNFCNKELTWTCTAQCSNFPQISKLVNVLSLQKKFDLFYKDYY